MNRREAIALLTAGLARARPPLPFAICNETFQNADIAQTCRLARSTGYTGLEIAPYTLSSDPAELSPPRRVELKRIVNGEGIAFVGLHNLLTAPEGLHATTSDRGIRERTWLYLRSLIDLCASLGPSGIMVFGSGKQRSAADAADVPEAERRLQDGLAGLAIHARESRVTILLEPLAPHLSNVVTSLERAVSIVRQIDNPAVRTMFDTHNAVKEKLPHGELVRKYFPYIRHVHVNEMDGRNPGTGDYDFKPLFRALLDLGYAHWISLEVFDFKAGGAKIARDSAQYLRRIEMEAAA